MALCKTVMLGEVLSDEVETRYTNDNTPVSKFVLKTSNNGKF